MQDLLYYPLQIVFGATRPWVNLRQSAFEQRALGPNQQGKRPRLVPPFHPQATTRTTYVVNMAKKNSFPDPLSQDIHRPLDLEKCSRGWETQEEHCYWIPKADIIGEVPKDLYGTLFRNGPGVNEVYGTRLKHRKYPKPGN